MTIKPPPALGTERGARLPASLVACERTLVDAFREVRLLGAATAQNAEAERQRALAELSTGARVVPRWRYWTRDMGPLRHELEAAARRASSDPWTVAKTYGARAEELALEAQMVDHIGTKFFGELAKRRFLSSDSRFREEAKSLAQTWIQEPRGPEDSATCASDSREPGSLLTEMENAIRAAGAAFKVIVRPDLVALAATGERHVLVALGRTPSREDVARTVMHEVEAHVMPRARAEHAHFAIFRVGTARGVDEQEGLALVLEERHGFFTARRRRELAARHLVVSAMDDGASFADAVSLATSFGFGPRESLMFAERAFRGGDGTHAGLGRERVYLESYVAVRARIAKDPFIERVLASGQVSLAAAEDLAPYAPIDAA